MKTLEQLEIGEKAIIKEVNAPEEIKRRFLDIGIVPEGLIECVLVSPLGDPIAYMIKGAMIAIRKEDVKGITVEVIEQ